MQNGKSHSTMLIIESILNNWKRFKAFTFIVLVDNLQPCRIIWRRVTSWIVSVQLFSFSYVHITSSYSIANRFRWQLVALRDTSFFSSVVNNVCDANSPFPEFQSAVTSIVLIFVRDQAAVIELLCNLNLLWISTQFTVALSIVSATTSEVIVL